MLLPNAEEPVIEAQQGLAFRYLCRKRKPQLCPCKQARFLAQPGEALLSSLFAFSW